jgi:hypothetical protein
VRWGVRTLFFSYLVNARRWAAVTEPRGRLTSVLALEREVPFALALAWLNPDELRD